MKYFILLLSFLLFCKSSAKCQDAHFNQNLAEPVQFNPAMTGVFNGNYRVSSVFRKQWQSINRNNVKDGSGTPSFLTFAESVDLRLSLGSLRSGELGIGMTYLGDVVGMGKARSRTGLISVSYIKPLDHKASNFLSLGLQGGITQSSSDYADLRFGSRHESETEQSAGMKSEQSETRGNYAYGDLSAGMLWFYVKDERTNISIGTAMHHLNRPVQFLPEDVYSRLPARFTIHAGAEFKIIRHISLAPALNYMRQASFSEFDVAASVKVFFRGEQPMKDAVLLGLSYRMIRGGEDFLENESLIINTRLHFNKTRIGVSYNCLVSELKKGLTGGFEISLAYSGKFGKNRKMPAFPRW